MRLFTLARQDGVLRRVLISPSHGEEHLEEAFEERDELRRQGFDATVEIAEDLYDCMKSFPDWFEEAAR